MFWDILLHHIKQKYFYIYIYPNYSKFHIWRPEIFTFFYDRSLWASSPWPELWTCLLNNSIPLLVRLSNNPICSDSSSFHPTVTLTIWNVSGHRWRSLFCEHYSLGVTDLNVSSIVVISAKDDSHVCFDSVLKILQIYFPPSSCLLSVCFSSTHADLDRRHI